MFPKSAILLNIFGNHTCVFSNDDEKKIQSDEPCQYFQALVLADAFLRKKPLSNNGWNLEYAPAVRNGINTLIPARIDTTHERL